VTALFWRRFQSLIQNLANKYLDTNMIYEDQDLRQRRLLYQAVCHFVKYRAPTNINYLLFSGFRSRAPAFDQVRIGMAYRSFLEGALAQKSSGCLRGPT
jgi:hypothetical protein